MVARLENEVQMTLRVIRVAGEKVLLHDDERWRIWLRPAPKTGDIEFALFSTLFTTHLVELLI